MSAASATASADLSFCPPGSAAGQCSNPQGIAVDQETGRIYVADRGNSRIDVFEADRSFAFAFGWGVVDEAAELQVCGPKALPASGCLQGLKGSGAGEFTTLGDLAIDNDPTSPSQHDVYVLDGRNRQQDHQDFRVQKFNPEGEFLLTWGGGVITGGAAGTGNLTSKSKTITAVQTTRKLFEVGQRITGTGIPAETTILSLEPGKIGLSKAATAAGTGVALSVAEGPGNVPVNEIDKLINNSGPPTLFFSTPDPDSPNGFEAGQSLPNNATAAELQAALAALPNIGPGNVAVTGEKVEGSVHEYTIEFKGPRFADTDVVLRIGEGVGNRDVITLQNGGSGAEICTAAIAASCAGGVEAGEEGGQGRFGRSAHLALGPGGTVYVADCVRIGTGTECKDRLQKFQPSGTFVEEIALPDSQLQPQGLAVDSSGDFYVSDGKTIRKYGAAGSLVEQLVVNGGVLTLGIDSAGNLFAAEGERGSPVIAEYDPTLKTLRRFGYDLIKSVPNGLAPFTTPQGDVYSTEGDTAFYRSFPPAGPIVTPKPCEANPIGSASATLRAEINPEGKETKFHFEYSDDGGATWTPTTPESTLEKEAGVAAEDFFLHDAVFRVEGLEPETEYLCRVVATNADGTRTGEEDEFETSGPFIFGPAWTTDVKEETATVHVEGDPVGIPATGQIEYVDDASYQEDEFAEALSAPAGEISFGSSEGVMQLREATLSGLAPGTLYHYRLRVRNGSPPEGFICPEGKAACPELEHTFRTYQTGSERGDGRGYELVSPGLKNSAEVATPSAAGGLIEDANTIRIQAAAGSGEAITYSSFTSFADPESAPGTSEYLSKRTPTGWTTENISPFGQQAFPIVPPYNGFSADLGTGAFKVRSPALTSDCPEEYENLYLRHNADGSFDCLTPEAPILAQGIKVCFNYAGASADGTRAFFGASSSYAGAPSGTGKGFNLYEWSATDRKMHLVSVLPGGGTAPLSNSYGSARGSASCQVGQTNMRHVISADGSRAIWTHEPLIASEPTQLYVRVNGTETIQLDKVVSGNGKQSGEGFFWAASSDGSVVYFTDINRLVSNSKAEAGKPDLYRYEAGTLTNLTLKSVNNTAADVQGVVGASDDGTYVYFVAKGALSAEANKGGDKAVEGQNNLYLNHAGKTSFIATLSGEDQNDWETQPKAMSARISPDGRHLAFLSVNAKALAGFDNTVAAGGHCLYEPIEKELVGGPLCPQAFLFSSESEDLTCASCNPAGSRPLGPSLLPPWSNVYEGPRYLSDDGSRLFFESFDALSARDESPRRDVYEFEQAGSGTCTSASPDFDPVSGGCHFLLSSGRSEDETFLVDASSTGRDVFFSTRDALVGWDVNPNFDVYDAREGGGFAEPAPAAVPCEGEGCLPSVPSQPTAPAPATPTFVGPGNQAPKPKPKHKKHHKAKKKKAPNKKKQQHKAGHRRGAGR